MRPSPGRGQRTRSLAFLALLVLIVAVWLPRLRGPIDLRWDGGVYYVLGTALAQGQGYRLLNEPGEIEAVQYPPLLPAIVALHQLVLGTSDPLVVGHWLRLTFFLMFAVHALSSYVLLRRFLPNRYALAGVAVCVLHLFTMFLSDLLSAELPFAHPYGADEPGIVRHMNDDHADALVRYWRAATGAEPPEPPVLLGLDPCGMDLRAGEKLVRVPFDAPVRTAHEVRAAVIALLRRAEA